MPQADQYEQVASAKHPTRHGMLAILSYRRMAPYDEVVVVQRRAEAMPDHAIPLVRVQSACLTGEALGSLRCDCSAQLQNALAAIADASWGILVYLLLHEGRGIGLSNKIRAYALQDCGRNTIEANRELGLEVDARSYEGAAAALFDLGATRINLMTNNPEKVRALEAAGIRVVERMPMAAAGNAYNQAYLELKRSLMGHEGILDCASAVDHNDSH